MIKKVSFFSVGIIGRKLFMPGNSGDFFFYGPEKGDFHNGKKNISFLKHTKGPDKI